MYGRKERGCISFDSYIKPQLFIIQSKGYTGCISFDSYIKPQHAISMRVMPLSCISFDSYIKPQLKHTLSLPLTVVYLLIPTSNHNMHQLRLKTSLLYIFWFLHQTTTHELMVMVGQRLYIFWFLHQTTTLLLVLLLCRSCISFDSYIKPQLPMLPRLKRKRCISFDSYIKPQLRNKLTLLQFVVYLLIPTSNHN